MEANMASHVPTLTSNIKHLYFDTLSAEECNKNKIQANQAQNDVAN